MVDKKLWLRAVKVSIASVLLVGVTHAQFNKLHDFTRFPDINPVGAGAFSGNILFGTTLGIPGYPFSDGTIWSFDTTSNEFKRIYDFNDTADTTGGRNPNGLVVIGGDTLYGTTRLGGALSYGILWSMDISSRTISKLYEFGGQRGDHPRAIALQGNKVFGTTQRGGSGAGEGTLWSFDINTHAFSTLHIFHRLMDGLFPSGDIAVDGHFIYGTTEDGGANNDGTVWSFDTVSGTFTKLHDFDFAVDGRRPTGGVILKDRILYGTSSVGGTADSNYPLDPFGAGTVWSLTTDTGIFTKLHDFTFTDGYQQGGSVRLVGHRLIGTAVEGGANTAGTIWSFDTSTRSFEVLHHFNSRPEGENPVGTLAVRNNTVFGTTLIGGRFEGTIWSLVVPEPNSLLLLLVGTGCFLCRTKKTPAG